FKLGGKETHAGDVAARLVEACHQAEPDRVITASEHDRNRGRRRLGGQRWPVAAARNDQRHLLTDQFFRHRWQSVVLALSPAQIDPYILAVDEASFAQTLPQSG